MKKLQTNRLMSVLICGLALLLSSCTDQQDSPVPPAIEDQQEELLQVADDFESRADFLTAAYKKTKPQTTKVWDATVDPDDFVLLFVREDQKKIYLIDDNGKQEIPESDWPTDYTEQPGELVRGSFLLVDYKGRNSCMILDCRQDTENKCKMMGKAFNPTMYTCDLLTLFYHESFHRYVQDGKNRWTNPKNTSGQAPQVFPVDYNSRVYRKLMVLSLVNVLYDANRKTESYSRAKYWLNKFNTEYASELERAKFTDIHEGTAEYFGRNVVHSVYHQYPVIQDYDGTNLASPLRTEAYMLSIAIDLAVRDGRKDEVLKSFVNGLQSPIEILLKDIPVPTNYQESADDADRNRIVAELDKLYGPESNIMKPLFDFIATHRSGKSTYLVTKTRNNAMIQDLGHYILTDNDLNGYQASLQAIVLLENIALEGCTFLEHPATGCVFVPVDANNLTLTNIKTVEPIKHKIEGVTINGTATLSDCTPSETVTVQNLPIDVKIGKDSFGNTIYFLQNN